MFQATFPGSLRAPSEPLGKGRKEGRQVLGHGTPISSYDFNKSSHIPPIGFPCLSLLKRGKKGAHLLISSKWWYKEGWWWWVVCGQGSLPIFLPSQSRSSLAPASRLPTRNNIQATHSQPGPRSPTNLQKPQPGLFPRPGASMLRGLRQTLRGRWDPGTVQRRTALFPKGDTCHYA